MVLRSLRGTDGGPAPAVKVVAVLLVLLLVGALSPTLVPLLRSVLDAIT
ncbi:hypothetical protein [Pseudokineococcus sp. 1T1Z-3]